MTTQQSTPYVVLTYPVVKHKLPGTEAWARLANQYSQGALWNNGTWVMRDVRGQTGTVSNHARGVAMDLSYRYMQSTGKGVSDGRRKAIAFLQTCLDNWQTLGIQCVLDYWPKDYGRGWRCDRVNPSLPKPHSAEAWVKYAKPTIHGAPNGDWLHIEITRTLAESQALVEQAFRRAFPTV